MSVLYIVRRNDGRCIARALSNYTVAGGSPYLWTRHPARAREFADRELAERLCEVALQEEPECGARMIEVGR